LSPVGVLLLGYVVAAPFFVYGLLSFSRIPAETWTYSTDYRAAWFWGMLAAYACFGIPSILVVFVWLRSETRAQLSEELRQQRVEERELRAASRRLERDTQEGSSTQK
jgi:hypothetical protein